MENRDVFNKRKEAKELRGQAKINKLLEGIEIANNIFHNEEGGEWTKKAIAWVLIDLVKEYISLGNISKAEQYYSQLLQIEFYESDDIISNQIQFLKPKIDIQYKEIKQAEDLSKEGKHSEAFKLMKQLIALGKLKPMHHESYGWIIYRYIKSEINTIDSVNVRTHLRDYMNLQNDRPSLLHSMILNFGLNYSKEHSDLNLLNFFNLWGPENLRYEDITDSFIEFQSIPSLISRVFKELIEKEYEFDIKEVFDKLNKILSDLNPSSSEISDLSFGTGNEYQAIDLVREPFFWKLYNLKKAEDFDTLWVSFENYNRKYYYDEASPWHSKILNLSVSYMSDSESQKFLKFFKDWNFNLLRSEDWKEVEKDGKTYKPLGIKALKKAFKYIKESEESDLEWLIKAYERGARACRDNEWIKRELAILYDKNGNREDAVSVYKELAQDLNNKFYYWNEFANLLQGDEDLFISMLSKAVLLEKNEDFLGDVRLGLAACFEKKGLKKEVGIELRLYKENREKNNWKFSQKFDELVNRNGLSEGSNLDLYKKLKDQAEDFAFSDLPWTKLVFIDEFEDKKEKKRLVFTNGKGIEITPLKKNFNLQNIKFGQVFDFKLKKIFNHRSQLAYSFDIDDKIKLIEYKLLIHKFSNDENWSILDDEYAIVDYLNKEKKIVHAITFSNEEIFFKDTSNTYSVNDLLEGKKIHRNISNRKKTELYNINKIHEKNSVVDKLPSRIAIVDDVNHSKNLFHIVINSNIDSIIKFNETDIRPEEGDFLEVKILSKLDKKNNTKRFKVVKVDKTDKTNHNLVKSFSGMISLKYKSKSGTLEHYDLEDEEKSFLKPDFAFVNDFYVSKYILDKYNIRENTQVTVKAIKNGSKWKIIEVNKSQ